MVKKLLGVLLSFFVLSSCGPSQSDGTPENDYGIVTVASMESENSLSHSAYAAKSAKRVLPDERVDETQKILVWDESCDWWKSDYTSTDALRGARSTVYLTIKLNNPESYGIDALRIHCDDESALIVVDGEPQKLAYEADGTRVVNWSSENPYEKTYEILLRDENDINTISILDIRLAGHAKFQSKEREVDSLGRNELKVYRVALYEQTFFWTNTSQYYMEGFKMTRHVENVEVRGAGSRVEDDFVIATENGTLSIDYDYVFDDGTVFHRVQQREVSLLDVRFLAESSKMIVTDDIINVGYFGGTSPYYSEVECWNFVELYDGSLLRFDSYADAMLVSCVDHLSGEDIPLGVALRHNDDNRFYFYPDDGQRGPGGTLKGQIDYRERIGDIVYANYMGSNYTFDRVNNALVLMN